MRRSGGVGVGMSAGVKMAVVGPGGDLKVQSRSQLEPGVIVDKRNEAEMGDRIGRQARPKGPWRAGAFVLIQPVIEAQDGEAG